MPPKQLAKTSTASRPKSTTTNEKSILSTSMASRALRPNKNVNYVLMNSGEPVSLQRKCYTPRGAILNEEYFVERLIWRKNNHNRHTHTYLVKWIGYHSSDSTWEPETNIPKSIITNYLCGDISEYRRESFTAAFERAIHSRLKTKNATTIIEVDLEVYRYFFGEKSKLCGLEDFQCLNLPEHWFYIMNKDGTGRKLKFPIKLTPRLVMKTIFVKKNNHLVPKLHPHERCRIYSCTESVWTEDL